ncbi:capsular polysaccharide synthesis protein [Micrococcus sp. ACRRV]|uniref:capsular polysaccharide synthesis protein n=1 Tax=Micrococcus sp. ACRRV TaxID=2918203 RepID=UPI00351CCBE2
MLLDPAKKLAQDVKHALAQRPTPGNRLALRLADDILFRVSPHEFDSLRYPLHRFLRFSDPIGPTCAPVERIFTFWTGSNPMPEVRKRNLDRLEDISEIPVIRVTSENLPEWLVPDHPLHPAYEFLSLTHRSDYLRAYVLHHHGGGYSDIKAPRGSWREAFTELRSRSNAWMVGYPEDSPLRLPALGGNLELDLRRRFRHLVGSGAMIMRPRTPITGEWLAEVERRLDYFLPLLKRTPGGIRDESPDYAVGWTQLLADIMYPLSLKYSDRIIRDARLYPSSEDYR